MEQQQHPEQEDDPKGYVGPKPGGLFVAGLVIGALIIVALTAGLVRGHDVVLRRQTNQLAQTAAQGRRVLVAQVAQMGGMRNVEYPAAIHGYIETPVYAKIPGYLRSIRVDKGDRVFKGELLATLESPEIDKQVADAKANYWVQKVTDERNQVLLKQAVIAQQAADESRATMLQALATYQQLLAQQAYERIVAPFDGMVTARYVDPGTLIPQVITPSTGAPIVSLATMSPLRIYADVPQSLALFIRNGDPAKISIYERPDRVYSGPIIRHPAALDATSGTMRVEVDLPNTDSSLLPGMYARMGLTLAVPRFGVMVRDDALIFRNNKVYVPVVRADRLHLEAVTLGYDNGNMVVVTGEVNDNDMVALNVGQAAEDGELVQPVQDKE